MLWNRTFSLDPMNPYVIHEVMTKPPLVASEWEDLLSSLPAPDQTVPTAKLTLAFPGASTHAYMATNG